jgi:hypothetical protein
MLASPKLLVISSLNVSPVSSLKFKFTLLVLDVDYALSSNCYFDCISLFFMNATLLKSSMMIRLVMFLLVIIELMSIRELFSSMITIRARSSIYFSLDSVLESSAPLLSKYVLHMACMARTFFL